MAKLEIFDSKLGVQEGKTPNTSALSSPIAKEITNKNRIDVAIGPITVCPNTVKKRKVSFLYKL